MCKSSGVEVPWLIAASYTVQHCPPFSNRRGIVLKIDTNTDTDTCNVTELDINLLPEENWGLMWYSCAVALDGCIYFMPVLNANRSCHEVRSQ